MTAPDEARDTGVGHARSVLGSADVLVERARDLLTAPERLRARAVEQLADATAGEVERQLRAMPIETLKDAAGRGARFGSLQRAGMGMVGDVLDAGPQGLGEVPGVGPATADQVSRAARAALVAVHREVRFRFDPDRRDAAQTALLGTLTAMRVAEAAAAELRPELTRLTDLVVPLADAARVSGSRWSRLLSWPSTRRDSYRSLAELDDLLTAPSTTAVRAEIDRRSELADPSARSAERLWNDYRQDAASVNALLSTLEVGEVDEEAAHGFVPTELGDRIDRGRLDTSRLRPATTLRGYQAFGARYVLDRGRTIVGDEMGLGKTLQALAAMAHLAAGGAQRFLVVCPASVQINWLNETGKFTTLTVYSLHGAAREDAGADWLREGGVAVTTFGTLGRLPDTIRNASTSLLVVDEAHLVKNPDAERSRAVRAVIGRSERTVFLTGTPMENRVEEFRTLVGYLNERVGRRIDARVALGGARAFRRAVAEVYLRRNQADVLNELPELIETESWVHPSPSDMAAYRDAVVTGAVMTMRRAAWVAGDSAKLDRLTEIVAEAAADGLKVLVFSTFLDVLSRIEHSVPGVVGRIDGSVSPTARQTLVDEFSGAAGHGVLVSQIDAGGTGINVQAASVVVLAEPQWKPSTEEQAIARAHRMGQTRPVQVHRLLAKDTVDERVREIQDGKRLLFDDYARRSVAKDADRAAVDTGLHRPAFLDDESVPQQQRVVLAERHRLGLS